MPNGKKPSNSAFLKTLEQKYVAEEAGRGGWEELKIVSGEKYDKLIAFKTDKGKLTITAGELFIQYHFRKRVFETFMILLKPVKEKIYQEWLAVWMKKTEEKDMDGAISSSLISDFLEEFTDRAEEDMDVKYIKKGIPVIQGEETLFRLHDFWMWIKKQKNVSMSRPQLVSLLNDLHCQKKQVGEDRIRVWAYSKTALSRNSLL